LHKPSADSSEISTDKEISPSSASLRWQETEECQHVCPRNPSCAAGSILLLLLHSMRSFFFFSSPSHLFGFPSPSSLEETAGVAPPANHQGIYSPLAGEILRWPHAPLPPCTPTHDGLVWTRWDWLVCRRWSVWLHDALASVICERPKNQPPL
jgi:hypothetical protein